MARASERLTALKVEKAKKPGMYADGGGLYLRVTPEGARNWVLRYMLDKKPHWMGLGPLSLYGLAEARVRALEARRQRHDGVDPISARRALRARLRLDAAKSITFRDCAEQFIAAHRAGWRNPKHAAQWSASLTSYAYPAFGSLPVAAVDVGLVMKAIEPIWATKPETASRVRGRVESILDWATVRTYRVGENPARWRGNLESLLAAPSKAKRAARATNGRGEHHAALPYGELPAFLPTLREQAGVAARALEFAILTAGRTGEVIGATWGEIDLGERLWIIPAARMKAHREHRVPLSPRALAILSEMRAARRSGDDGAFVFPGQKTGKALSNMAFLMLLRRMGRDDLTAHGFRSTFSDWVAERTNFTSEVREMALAHAVGDKVEAAYRRGDLLEKRRRLAEAWAAFCGEPKQAGEVVALRPAG
jgi:integrase